MSDAAPVFDVTPFLNQDEGQHFDRKSMLHGPPGQKRSRDRRVVRDQVAEYVAAFANAEGGVLVLGIEDDHSLTGHQLNGEALAALLNVPQARVQPPQPPGFVKQVGGVELIIYDVPTADVPVQVTGDGFPLRIGDQTVQASETQIGNLKLRGLVESWESTPSPLTLDDLDADLLARAKHGAGLDQLADVDYLLKRKLADRRGTSVVLRRAAELLFAADGPDHPNAGVRIFRVVGSERLVGARHNVEERPRIEGNLPGVWTEALTAVGGLLRQPSRLVGNRFRQVSEYPRFSWQEALLNAIAHRDYAVQGQCTEVWLFDNRMEVRSPGSIVPDLSLERLLSLERVHASRNPRLMRVLVDLGMARDQGEGIPRMFAEMADAFLPRPVITSEDRSLSVTLGNTPTLTDDDHGFIAQLGDEELSEEEFRALLHAHRHGQVDNSQLRLLVGLETLAASQVLRRLRDRGLLDLHAAGAHSYYTLAPKLGVPEASGHLLLEDGGTLLTEDGEPLQLESTPAVTPEVTPAVASLLQAISAHADPVARRDLQESLKLSDDKHFREHYIRPALAAGVIAMTRPTTPNSRLQAYYLTDRGRSVLEEGRQ
jgi:ATP-dependent DNA helicase RecG